MEDPHENRTLRDIEIPSPAQKEEKTIDGCQSASDEPSPRSASLTSFGWAVLCTSMLLAEVQAALDSTMTANLQPTILHTFGEISKLPWINVTYSLGLSGSCLVWGKLLHFIGRKKILLLSRFLFAVGSALTAAAPSMEAFIVGKIITGVGSSGTYIPIINIITIFTSDKDRSRYFGYFGFMWGLGTILGPPIGATFAVTNAGWRWSFYFNLILVGVALPAFLFILPFQAKK